MLDVIQLQEKLMEPKGEEGGAAVQDAVPETENKTVTGQEAEAGAEPVVKRGRGRPKKAVMPETAPGNKRGLGRPGQEADKA
jgi:hypothetical protein